MPLAEAKTGKTQRDFIYPYRPPHHHTAKCRVRLWQHNERTIVLISELPDNPGMSVTKASEQIATSLVCDLALDPATVVWHPEGSRHYPQEGRVLARRSVPPFAESFDVITFAWDRRNEASTPEWKRVSQAFFESLIGKTWTTEFVSGELVDET